MSAENPDRRLPDSISANPREMRIGELLNEYLDRRERGDAISEDDFLSLHPEFAAELREHFRGVNLIRDLNAGSGAQAFPGEATHPVAAGSSAQVGLGITPSRLPEIPGYDVLKQIGRGGMGVVFKAVQRSTKRIVALKVLMEGPLASEAARNRFTREIALAAQLRHAYIIPIYDSGDVDGRLYYAMEHVYGLPLNDYVRAHQLPIPARLRLFARICEAVSHAHQRGVIHRDLKPSNILVDGNGDPHVLDFGLAKAGSMVDMTTSMTAQIIGTPAYMSPEQAAGDPGGIDTRSDVYSLGVVMYEMLTGHLPYDTNVAMGRILHNIAHTEPANPSRYCDELDADMCAIILKALEKDRNARYQSVDALRIDVVNHGSGGPVTARPPTSLYLLRKLVFRHRLVVSVCGAILLISAISAWLVSGSMRHSRELEHATTKQAAELEESREERDALVAQREAASDVARDMLKTLAPEYQARFMELAAEAFAAVSSSDKAAKLHLVAARILAELSSDTSSETTGENADPAANQEAMFQTQEFQKRLNTLLRLVLSHMAGTATTQPAEPPSAEPGTPPAPPSP